MRKKAIRISKCIGKKTIKPIAVAAIIAVGYKAIKWSYINDMIKEVA